MEIGPSEGHECDFSAMFDRVDHPARGRQGGLPGGATRIQRSDGASMRGKGKQFVPHGCTVQLEYPGGAGYGRPEERDQERVKRDLARGYISAQAAEELYGLGKDEIEQVASLSSRGEII